MSVTPAQARKLAVALDNTSASPHFNRTAFRTPRRIFATLANDGDDLNLMFDPALRDFFCEQDDSFSPVPGGWGKQGATRCDLKRVDKDTLLSALKAAHALANTPKPGAKKPVAKKHTKKAKRSG